jgi:hypothetical protein
VRPHHAGPVRDISLEDLRTGLRFFRDLPGFLRRPLDVDMARAILVGRLRERERDFLALARTAIYDQPTSPYRVLLARAGCEHGDLRRLVAQEGIEGALGRLAREGVYLTVDELKGRTPVVRGTTTLALDPARLWNPLVRTHAVARSSGSRGRSTPVPVDLRFVRDLGVDICLTTAARGGLGWRHASWTIPGSAAIAAALSYSAFGAHWVRWFSQVDPAAPVLHARYRWSTRVMRWGGRLAGVSLPVPRYVSLEDPRPIVDWLTATLAAGEVPHLLTFPSSAIRVCAAAARAGRDLQGVQLMLGGEPITPARLAVIHGAGATVTTGYGTAETGPCGVGDACLAPAAADEVHVFHDLHALIQSDASWPGAPLPAGTLLASSLRPSAPVVLLNASLGDQALLSRRACGCPLQQLGWSTHLHSIRSHEKLTSAGMAFLDGDVVRVLEEALPARFGGIPTDYQLVEDEGEDGRPRLRLLVHPSLGPLDPKLVADAFLDGIGPGSGVERLMGLVWREAGVVEVERRPPYATSSGKLLHVHVEHRGAVPPA